MEDIQLNNKAINVTLRNSLFPLFQDKVREAMGEWDCSYLTLPIT